MGFFNKSSQFFIKIGSKAPHEGGKNAEIGNFNHFVFAELENSCNLAVH